VVTIATGTPVGDVNVATTVVEEEEDSLPSSLSGSDDALRVSALFDGGDEAVILLVAGLAPFLKESQEIMEMGTTSLTPILGDVFLLLKTFEYFPLLPCRERDEPSVATVPPEVERASRIAYSLIVLYTTPILLRDKKSVPLRRDEVLVFFKLAFNARLVMWGRRTGAWMPESSDCPEGFFFLFASGDSVSTKSGTLFFDNGGLPSPVASQKCSSNAKMSRDVGSTREAASETDTEATDESSGMEDRLVEEEAGELEAEEEGGELLPLSLSSKFEIDAWSLETALLLLPLSAGESGTME